MSDAILSPEAFVGIEEWVRNRTPEGKAALHKHFVQRLNVAGEALTAFASPADSDRTGGFDHFRRDFEALERLCALTDLTHSSLEALEVLVDLVALADKGYAPKGYQDVVQRARSILRHDHVP